MPASRKAGRREQEALATREALVDAAVALFAERGYAGVGTEEIVKRASVTRGALYHHFADKRDLFRAAHEAVETDLVESIAARMGDARTSWDVLLAGMRAMLDACDDPAVTRIGLVDAPSVLGWPEWRAIEERYGLGMLRAALSAGIEDGTLRPAPLDALAHLLLAALVEAAFMVTYAEDREAARAEAERGLVALLEGLRAPG
jgi:AcrR family transcriptional regulator